MPRAARGQPAEPTVGDVARERILAATERCVDRYGLRKTTIDDVACEVGLSRPSIYRYFVDRDDLLIELITRHARALIKRTHRATSRQSSPSDQLIESILYIGELARPRLPDPARARSRSHESGSTNDRLGKVGDDQGRPL
jgi:AcrR family transcriptional regulator